MTMPMRRLQEAYNNDVLLSMASSFCVGLGLGVFMLVFTLPHWWWELPMAATLALFWSGLALLGRAERLRAARWQRHEWR